MLISVNTTKIENSENGLLGLATVSFGDAMKVQSIAIKAGKEGKPFVAMPSYKTKQTDEQGKPVYKDICNPITKDFRDALYGAILSSLENGREAIIGEADGRTKPEIGVKVTPLDRSDSATKGLATLYLDNQFVISNVAVKKSHEGKMFISMPSYKTNQVDEEGKPVYKDIAYPASKEARDELQHVVVEKYFETYAGIDGPVHTQAPAEQTSAQSGFMPVEDSELPFDNGEKSEDKTSPQKPDAKKEEKPKTKDSEKADKEKPKSIKDRLADGEAKKAAKDAIKDSVPKPTKGQEIA